MFFRRKKGEVWLLNQGPSGQFVHIDLDGTRPLSNLRGALLLLAAPSSMVDAARLSRRGCGWCVWGLQQMPVNDRRAAAFIVSLARAMRVDTLYVVLDETSGRAQRIAGHLMRSGCVVQAWPVTVPQRKENDERHDFA